MTSQGDVELEQLTQQSFSSSPLGLQNLELVLALVTSVVSFKEEG
jgi:hypothetical protein